MNQQNGIIRVIVQNELTLFRVNDFSSGYCTNSMILLGANIPRKCEDTKGVGNQKALHEEGRAIQWPKDIGQQGQTTKALHRKLHIEQHKPHD